MRMCIYWLGFTFFTAVLMADRATAQSAEPPPAVGAAEVLGVPPEPPPTIPNTPPPTAQPRPGGPPGRPPRGPFGGPPGDVEFWSVSPGGTRGGDFAASSVNIGYTLRDVYTRGDWSCSVRPQFQALFLDGPGPGGPDLPGTAYGLAVDLQSTWRIAPRTRLMFGITPGLYTDFDNLTGDAYRFPARLIGTYMHSPQWVFLGGVVYTAQPDLPIVPVAGAIWTPSERWRYELTFPRPRAVYKYSETLELYALGSFVTQAFAVRTGGRDDLFQYRDFRLGVGAEWYGRTGTQWYGEVGVAFARELGFNHRADQSVDPGLFFRVGSRF